MKKIVLFIVLILTLTLVFVGCSNSSDKEDKNVNNVEENNTEESKGENTEQNNDETKEEVLGKISDMDEYHYEMDVSGQDGMLFNTKMWVSNNKIRIESYSNENNENMIMIIDNKEKVGYFYSPKEKSAIKMSYDDSLEYTEESSQKGSQDYVQIMKEIANDEDIDIEEGTLDGEPVKIISSKIEGDTNKIWISNKTGFPLKSETYVDGKLSITTLFKNFEKKAIDPSIFIIPEGIEIIDMTELLKDIPK